MSAGVFLSRPNPVTPQQDEFLSALSIQLENLGLSLKTLGVTEYGLDAPLTTIRMLMSESNGLIVVGLRRYRSDAVYKMTKGADCTCKEKKLDVNYLTSPWCHIEPGMAYQIGLPILILRESGVLADGVFERGTIGLYMPEFEVESDPFSYLNSRECKSLLQQFSGEVHQFRRKRGATG